MSSGTLLQTVIWPAIAGNVIWSLISIHIDAVDHLAALPRSFPLALLAGYMLAILQMRGDPPRSIGYYVLDSLLAAAIATYALALYGKKEWADLVLAFVFLIVMVGYPFKKWYDAGWENKKVKWMILVNGVACAGVSVCWRYELLPLIVPSLAIVLVLGTWAMVKPWMLTKAVAR